MTMVLWTGKELEEALGSKSSGDFEVKGISIDSRVIEAGDLFVAIKGEQFDGHDYVAGALSRGAVAAIVSRVPNNLPEGANLFVVADTLKALETLARYRRAQMKGKVVGITGSVGKTSTKEMLAHVFSAQGKTHATSGNFNNHIGLPLTLARMPRDAEFAAIEMGMNHSGEIEQLTAICQPDVAIVTTVEAVHLEYFDSEQGIALEKAQVYGGLTEGGTAILNRDNRHYDYMRQQVEQFGIQRIRTFGHHPEADSHLLDYQETSDHFGQIHAMIVGEEVEFLLGVTGEHQAMNALAVLTAVDACGADVALAAAALADYHGAEGRGIVFCVRSTSHGTFCVMDDSYNASPASVKAAIKNLCDYQRRQGKGRSIAVLGDMLELGVNAPKMHAELAHNIVENDIKLVFTAGANMKSLYDALPEEKRGGHLPQSSDAAVAVADVVQDGDIVLVKGSHGVHMEKVVNALKELGDAV